jgi:sterol desaturase/sphingolipid hydroxylase (fatty acid hydroxylase superfamily)
VDAPRDHIPLDTAWGLALLFLGVELAYYWMHRASHEVRWMWASHVVHHSQQSIHLASAFRSLNVLFGE